MQKVFIFFGVGGHAEENWFPWLKSELESRGKQVIVPVLPKSNQPTLMEWSEYFARYNSVIDEQTIFVGHSLGGAFALRFLEQSERSVLGTFLVASVWGIMGNQFDPLVTTFTVPPYDWKVIRAHSKYFSVLHSDNDPYIQLSYAQELARNLSVDIEIIKKGGHFNTAAGYTAFPFLLKQIMAIGNMPL